MGDYDFAADRRGVDWKADLQDSQDIKLSQAVAASSAFPGAFGTLVLPSRKYYPAMQRDISKFSLVDGGVYDNTGLVSLFSERPGYIIGSDAGRPFEIDRTPPTGGFGFLDVPLYQRTVSIATDRQTEQTQWLIIELHGDAMGNNPAVFSIERFTPEEEANTAKRDRVVELTKIGTRLSKLSVADLQGLAGHGGDLLHYRLSQWCPQLLRSEDRLDVSRI